MENLSLPNLLIVDDNLENLALLKTILKNVNANIIEARTGVEALEISKDLDLMLAILDVRMPLMDGYELAILLNKGREDNKVPIIFITAIIAEREDILKGYEYGAVDFLLKPVSSKIIQSKAKIFLDLYNQKQTIIQKTDLLSKYASDLMEAHNTLEKSEKKYRYYIDNAPDGIFIVNEIGQFIELNIAACKTLGYSQEELLTMKIQNILGENVLIDELAKINQTKIEYPLNSDVSFKHKNGEERWLSFSVVALSKDEYLGFLKETTHRKRAEDDLQNSYAQLQKLSQHIEKVREEERIAISRDLHDDLGQALTAVKIDLGIVQNKVEDAEVVSKINKISILVSETIKTVQRLTSELRPQIIDDLGIEAAIEWYTTEYAERTGLEIVLTMDSEIAINDDAALTLFRIMQESLTNIARHANATRIEIMLDKKLDCIEFSISDNGIGILGNELNSKKSFGIMSMKERAANLGGTLSIKNNITGGTSITLSLPIKNVT